MFFNLLSNHNRSTCRTRSTEEMDLFWSMGEGSAPVSVNDNTQHWAELVDTYDDGLFSRCER